MMAPGTDYPREAQGSNYFRDNNIVISAAKTHICYNQTVYDDMLDEPIEYFGLTLSVISNNAQTLLGYNTAAVRIVDDDSKLYICFHAFVSSTKHTQLFIQITIKPSMLKYTLLLCIYHTEPPTTTCTFDPTTYTVIEGVDNVVNLRLFRSGNLTTTIVVTVTTAAGTAMGMPHNCLLQYCVML